MEAGLIRVLTGRWQNSVLVCGKCSKRLGGGFGDKGRAPLVKVLRAALGIKKGRKADRGIVEVKCLGICPKNAVVMIDSARPDRWMLVPAMTDATEILDMLDHAAPAFRHMPSSADQT